MDTLAPRIPLQQNGFAEYWQSQLSYWTCIWRNRTEENKDYTATAVCLALEADDVQVPAGCECPPLQPLEERFTRAEQAGVLTANGMKRVASRCDDDALLVGGSCMLTLSSTGADLYTGLVSMGFAADGAWECVWDNQIDTEPAATAVAMCLEPPSPLHAPEAEPLAERIVRVEERVTLPAGEPHIEQVTCDPGDFLLWGSCTLENPDDSMREINLFRSGFPTADQAQGHTWQCAWNNPTAATPTAIATALCLKPPSIEP